ncbi:MAG: hypothetical protein ACYC2H_01245 [Thermoplasmatota archaeon]
MDINQIVDLAKHVHDVEGYNLGETSSRDYRNAYWERVIGIVHHGHKHYNSTPDPRWHCKRADAGRPPSDDVVVLMPERDFWDCIGGSGGPGYTFRPNYDGKLPGDQIVFAPRVPDGGGGDTAPPPVKYWQQAHSDVLSKLGTPTDSSGDPVFVRRVAEQFAYSFPAEGWGQKRADPTRPVSDNTVARMTSTGLIAFRVVPFSMSPTFYDLKSTPSVFEAVTPKNYLAVEPPPPPPPVDPPVDPPTDPVDLSGVMTELNAIKTDVRAIAPSCAGAVDHSTDAVMSELADLAELVRTQGYDIHIAGSMFLPSMAGTSTPTENTNEDVLDTEDDEEEG